MLCNFQCYFSHFTLQRLKITGYHTALADEHAVHVARETVL